MADSGRGVATVARGVLDKLKPNLLENWTVLAVMGGLIQGVMTDHAAFAAILAACLPERHVVAEQA